MWVVLDCTTRVTWKSHKLDVRHEGEEGRVRRGEYAIILVCISGMCIVVKLTLEQATKAQGSIPLLFL